MSMCSTRGKVLVVARSVAFGDGVGGLERAVSDHVDALSALGWSVTLVAPRRYVKGEPTVAFEDVPWDDRWAAPGRFGFGLCYWLWVRRLAKKLEELLPGQDALYIHGGAAGALRKLRCVVDGVRVVANPHGMEEFQSGGLLRWTSRVFTRHLARGAELADVVLATDRLLIAPIQKNIRPDHLNIHLLPNAVNVERLDRLAREGSIVGGVSPDVVSVGRLTQNKGYDLLLDALNKMESRADAEPLLWRHFGSGDQLDELSAKGRSIPGLTAEFIPGADDATVQANLKATRVFVQPSRYEGSSLTTLEAMTHGVICVGTPVGGIPEKITDGVTGFLAAEVSADSIALALARAMDAPPSMGSAARARVLERFSLDAMARSLSDLLSSGRPPS